MPGVRRSDREIEEIEDRCLREYCELGQRLVDRDARGADAFVVGECEADRVVLPDLGADGSADLQREAAACFDTAAVRVVADVVERAEKLADEPTVRTVHLDAVNAAGSHVAGGAREVAHEPIDLLDGQRLGHLPARRRHERRCAYGGPVIEPHDARALSAPRHELREEPGRMVRQGGGDRLEAPDVALVICRNRTGERGLAQRTCAQLLREQQPGTAERALTVEGKVSSPEVPVAAVLECRG